MKLKKHLSFASLRKGLSDCFNKISEHRQAKKVRYSLHDVLMSGFACMYFQDPSLLQFQERLERKYHKSNLQTLFGIKKIPESTQLRAAADGVMSEYLNPFFKDYFNRLQRGKHLEAYQLFPNEYLMAIDATDYYSSYEISCDGCLKTKSSHKDKDEVNEDAVIDSSEAEKRIRYSHKALQVALMHPDMRQVIPLMPEEISNSDGTTKQDCETNAAKRLIPKIREAHLQLGIILTGDDLFSRQPMIEETLAAKMHYIYVAKPSNHKYLMEWLAAYPQLHEKEEVETKTGVRHVYRWMNGVPLHGGEGATSVNYFSYQIIVRTKSGRDKINYQNSWVTDIGIEKNNIVTLVEGGRCRWKVENECFNTLKNQGYCLEHSYGHGEKLSFNFYLLTLLAFSFHQIQELTDKLFQQCRKSYGSKKHLWDHFRAYIHITLFETWEQLLSFVLDPAGYLEDRAPPMAI